MIREYLAGDVYKIDQNEELKMDITKEGFVEKFERRENFVIEDNGEIRAIFSYQEYETDKYSVYTLYSKNFQLKHLKEAKRVWLKAMGIFKPVRVEATGKNNKWANKFHRFFGFKLECTKYNELTHSIYNLWGWS